MANGYNTINIDLNGNLYQCHNTNEICGNINTTNYDDYHNKIVELDTTKKNKKFVLIAIFCISYM